MKKVIIISIIVAVVALLGYYLIFSGPSSNENGGKIVDGVKTSEPVTDDKAEEIFKVLLPYEGVLEDVTGGNASGIARSGVFEDDYFLSVTFENLPKLDPGYFYEGWVVRKFPFDFISTGELTKSEGEWINMFTSDDAGLIKYTEYVLTLEPDDGDPDPAGHVLEGIMKK